MKRLSTARKRRVLLHDASFSALPPNQSLLPASPHSPFAAVLLFCQPQPTRCCHSRFRYSTKTSGLWKRSHLVDGLERISSFTRKGSGCISMPNRADKTEIPVTTLSLFWRAASRRRAKALWRRRVRPAPGHFFWAVCATENIKNFG